MNDSTYREILIGGSIALDDVQTPQDSQQNLLGGSASYAGLAAQFFSQKVALLGIVGKDFPQEYLELFASRGLCIDGVERSEEKTFRWSGQYHANLNKRTTLSVCSDVLESWKVKVPQALRQSGVICLANMAPSNQKDMLQACQHREKWVIADTMDLWIDTARDALLEVLKETDIFVLNESEARMLSGEYHLLEAGKRLLDYGSSYLIIKLGEYGSLLFGSQGELFRIHAYPLANIVDPTGAGDTFLGGLAGSLSLEETLTFGAVVRGALRGSVLASFTCEDFSVRRLEQSSILDMEERLDDLHAMSCWPLDLSKGEKTSL